MAQHALVGIYQSRQQASNAVDMLREHGFRNEDISVLLPDNVGTKDFAHEKNTKAPEGAVAGSRRGSRRQPLAPSTRCSPARPRCSRDRAAR